MIEQSACLVFTTCANESSATEIAKSLVSEKLAACVNIIPHTRSIYMWEDKLHDDQEYVMMIKTTSNQFGAIQAWCEENHPYDLPELIQINLSSGSPAYLQWISDNLGK